MQIQELQTRMAANPALRAQLVENPEQTIQTLAAGAPLQTDVFIYRLVVGALGLTLVVGMLGALVLAFFQKNVPAEATALGSAAVGALAGLLAPSPRQ